MENFWTLKLLMLVLLQVVMLSSQWTHAHMFQRNAGPPRGCTLKATMKREFCFTSSELDDIAKDKGTGQWVEPVKQPQPTSSSSSFYGNFLPDDRRNLEDNANENANVHGSEVFGTDKNSHTKTLHKKENTFNIRNTNIKHKDVINNYVKNTKAVPVNENKHILEAKDINDDFDDDRINWHTDAVEDNGSNGFKDTKFLNAEKLGAIFKKSSTINGINKQNLEVLKRAQRLRQTRSLHGDMKEEVVSMEENEVEHGSACMLDPYTGSREVLKCRDGQWALSRNLDLPVVIEKGTPNPIPPPATRWEHRGKRQASVTWYTRHCVTWCRRSWWWRRCWTHCWTVTHRNYLPTITCPRVSNPYYTDIREMSKVITWPPATATDVEDGPIGTRQSWGPRSGERLPLGGYRVNYVATDSRGHSSYCGFNIYLYEIQCPIPTAVSFSQWKACGKHTYPNTCTLSCDPGFKVQGASTISCQRDETWTTAGSCIDVQAPTFSCPSDMTVYSQPKRQPTSVAWVHPSATDNSGETIVVTSDHQSGHIFPVGQARVSFQAVDTSINLATCAMTITVQVKECPVLTAPTHGNISCSYGRAEGSECTMECFPGFELVGVSTRSCLGSQEWSGSQPVCQRLSCGSPPQVENGYYPCPSGVFEDTCTLVCNAGYVVESLLTITCDSSPKWTDVGSCRDVQPPKFPQGCSEVSVYAAAFGQETYVSYSSPSVTDNSGVVTVSMSPPSGSSFEIGLTNVTVTAEDGSGNSEECIFTVNVIQIQCVNPLNADLDDEDLMEFSCPDGHVYGTECELSCSDHNPVQGPSTIRCEQNGTKTGYWWYGNIKPYCEAKACSAPQTPKYGAVACDELADREICVVQCNSKYSFPKMDLQNGAFVCFARTGEWLPREIGVNLCVAGRVARHVEMMPDIYYYSDSCSTNHQEIEENFLAVINDTAIFDQVCTSKNVTCSIDSVSISCGEKSKRSVREVDPLSQILMDGLNRVSSSHLRTFRKRSAGRVFKSGLAKKLPIMEEEILSRSKRGIHDATHITKAVFVIKISFYEQGTASDTMQFYTDLMYELNAHFDEGTVAGRYAMPDVGETDDFSFGYSDTTFDCPAPTLFQSESALCAGCGQGYVYINQDRPCYECPVGTYQPEDEGRSCLSCPTGSTTRYAASTSADQCLALCHPGTYSKIGMQPCEVCPRGTYQPQTRMAGCFDCPYGMTTSSEGADSEDDCQFYNIKWTNTTTGPQIDDSDGPVVNFTLAMWIRTPSDLVDTHTTISLQSRGGYAAVVMFGSHFLWISVEEDLSSRNRRQWHHAMIVSYGTHHILYVNGKQVDSMFYFGGGSSLSDARFYFLPGLLTELHISELQMSRQVLTEVQAGWFSSTCGQRLDGHILLADESTTDSLTAPSTCDAQDNCANSPCGQYGTCYDLLDTYRCECEGQWTGDNCEIEPDFCQTHQCTNGAECVNHPHEGNYTCSCTEDYTGRLCAEIVVHGQWTDWSSWSLCSVTCGTGVLTRQRSCDNPAPGPDGRFCDGDGEEVEDCGLDPCPVDGGYSEWSSWTCQVTCGDGQATRSRTCDNPSPAHGGKECQEAAEDVRDCNNTSPCPVDGSPGQWSDWSSCSASCEGGVTTRSRECDSPAPQHGGSDCDPTLLVESETCNEEDCPTCKRLARTGRNIQTIECTYNDTEDMTECYIVCNRGYITDEETTYTCGRETNFTWSHVTIYNPRGHLPDCEEATVPVSRTLTVGGTYQTTALSSSAVNSSVQANMASQVACTTCQYQVAVNEDLSRKKRSVEKRSVATSMSVQASVVVTSPNININLTEATDAEIEELIDVLYDFDMAAQRLANNTADILTVTVNGQNYTIDQDSLTVILSMICPDGTEILNGLCVNCGAGTYSSDFVCEPCPQGQYQENVKSTSCDDCPRGTSTAGVGARSLAECVEDPSLFYPAYLGYVGVEADESTGQDASDTDLGLIIGAVVGGVVFAGILVALIGFAKPIKQALFGSSKTDTQLVRGQDKPKPSAYDPKKDQSQPSEYFVRNSPEPTDGFILPPLYEAFATPSMAPVSSSSANLNQPQTSAPQRTGRLPPIKKLSTENNPNPASASDVNATTHNGMNAGNNGDVAEAPPIYKTLAPPSNGPVAFTRSGGSADLPPVFEAFTQPSHANNAAVNVDRPDAVGNEKTSSTQSNPFKFRPVSAMSMGNVNLDVFLDEEEV